MYPFLLAVITAVLLSQVEDVEISLAPLSPSVPSFNLSWQDLGKTSWVCPPLTTPFEGRLNWDSDKDGGAQSE